MYHSVQDGTIGNDANLEKSLKHAALVDEDLEPYVSFELLLLESPLFSGG
jgi:hypothetical protein